MHLGELPAELRRAGLEAGLDAVGICSAEPFEGTRRVLAERRTAGLSAGMQFTYRNPRRSTTPADSLAGAAALVVGARRYLRSSPVRPSPIGRPVGRVARYSWIDHYQPLRQALEAVAELLRSEGWAAKVLADDNALVDRAAAHRAGLGWYGKNTNILLRDAGSWFVLGSVLTTAPLPADRPVEDGCGRCRRCLPACPTGALSGPGVLDARRCLAWLVQAPGIFPREHRVALGDRLYGCDDCQEACPANRVAIGRGPPAPAEAEAEPVVDLLELLSLPDEELLARWGRWYIPRREPRYLRRNALVILGNTGDPSDPEVRGAVRRALSAPDPLLRAHAVWAAQRLGLDDLLEDLADDHPLVQAELAALGDVPRRRARPPTPHPGESDRVSDGASTPFPN